MEMGVGPRVSVGWQHMGNGGPFKSGWTAGHQSSPDTAGRERHGGHRFAGQGQPIQGLDQAVTERKFVRHRP